MTLTIDLTPEQEARLQKEAARHGLDPTDYARRLFDRLVIEDSEEAWEADLDALTEGHETLPVLAPQATTRAHIYGERG